MKNPTRSGCSAIERVSQRGLTLTELMVGLAVGLVATVAILQTFALAEGRKRNTTGIADAQQAGSIALFILARDIANGGNGIAAAASELGTCPNSADIHTTQRPIPIVITAGASTDLPDTLVINHGVATTHAASVAFAEDATAQSNYRIRSPFGLSANDRVVAISPTGQCAASTIVSVSAPDAEGVVDVVHSGAPDAYPASSVLLNLGQLSRVMRVRYDIADATLRSLDLFTPGATPNPLASNIVLMKAQYGVDLDNDGYVDTWVSPATTPWAATDVLAASAATLAQIKAVRIGLIVRSDSYDRGVTRRFDWVLFDCAREDKTQCAGRLTGSMAPGWRYRKYETAVPLRNQIWNG